jgi:hypothetical protein
MPAKGTVKFILTPAILAKAEAASARGLDHDDIARVLGISVATLYDHKAKNEEFAEAIRRGKAKGHLAIADAVYNKAKAGNMDAARLILSRRYGWHETMKQQLSSDPESPLKPQVMIYLPDNGRGPKPTMTQAEYDAVVGRTSKDQD